MFIFFKQILNHCIDDIENLVMRTKRSAEAWKRLNKKKGKAKRKLLLTYGHVSIVPKLLFQLEDILRYLTL